METKEQILQKISASLQSGLISSADVAALLPTIPPVMAVSQADMVQETGHRVGVSDVLYGIGALIVFIGISIFLNQNWSTFSSVTKILSTLGIGIAAYVIGTLLSRDEKVEVVSGGFFLLSALTLPVGIAVCFDLANFNIGDSSVMILITGLLSVIYVASYFLFKKNLFIVFATIFCTSLYYAIINNIVGALGGYGYDDLYMYATMMLGLAYGVLGYSFTRSEVRSKLTGTLYGFGVLFILGAGLNIGGIWDVLYIGLVFGVILLSVYLKSRAFLTFGAIFLMGYLIKITSKYFADAIGWPIALIFAGFALIGVGYFAYFLNQKFISQKV